MVFEPEAVVYPALDKKAVVMDDCGAENRHFSARASCFRRLGTSKKSIKKNTCFDDSIVFQACFERLRKLIKLLNLARASRLRLTLTHHKTMENVVFVDSIMFQACFERLRN